MTDKELKKLSRLELLELLLEESRENERLRTELERLRLEGDMVNASQRISQATEQLDTVIDNAKRLADTLDPAYTATERQSDNKNTESVKKVRSVDADIYKRIMVFFSRNPRSIIFLPEDIRSDVEKRLREIAVRKNKSL